MQRRDDSMTSTGEPRRRHRDATTSEMVDTRYSTAIKHTQIMGPRAFCRAAGGDVARCGSLSSRPGRTLETMEYVGGWGGIPAPEQPLDHSTTPAQESQQPLDHSTTRPSLPKSPWPKGPVCIRKGEGVPPRQIPLDHSHSQWSRGSSGQWAGGSAARPAAERSEAPPPARQPSGARLRRPPGSVQYRIR